MNDNGRPADPIRIPSDLRGFANEPHLGGDPYLEDYGDSADSEHFEDFEDEDLEPYEEILDEWLELGWFEILPSAVMTITTAFEDISTPRQDFDAATAEAVDGGTLTLLDGDPLWPVLSPGQAAEDGITEPGEYEAYLAGVTEQRAEWADLAAADPRHAISTPDELLSLLIGWGLLGESGDELHLLEPVPDPLDLLQLPEQTIASIVLDRMGPELEAVEDVLHEFLHHGDQDELITSLQKLGTQAEVSPEVARLTVAMLISDPGSGITAHRGGELDPEGVENLKEHQKFTLRVDRNAPGFTEHEH